MEFQPALLIRTVVFACLCVLPNAVIAQDVSEEASESLNSEPPIEVQWYMPEIGETQAKNRTRVIVPGKTTPGAKIFVNSKAVLVISETKKVGYLSTRKAMASDRVVVADADGYFALELDLPNYTIQLPIGIAAPGSRKVSKKYQLNLSIEAEKVRYTNLNVVSKSPAYTKRYGLWFGTGFNYLRYVQKSSTINSNLEFQTLKGPSAFGKAWMWLSETWDISATAKMSPGNTSSSENVQVDQGSYDWLIFAGEGTYYPASHRYNVFDTYKAQLAWRFGVQYHVVPFVARGTSSPTQASIKTNDVTMATAGFKFLIRQHSRFSYEVFMRYQYPLSSGDLFSIRPRFAFDGSVGAIYEYTKNWRIGLFWYGQWHEYDFTHEDAYRLANNVSGGPMIDGSQTLFFSNFEIRAGYEFN